jgi:lysophospholipase L1-like esterase
MRVLPVLAAVLAGLLTFASSGAQAAGPAPVYVALGDSITADLWGPGGYPRLLATALGAQLVNLASAGMTAVHILTALPPA